MFGAYVAMVIRGVFCVILYGVIASLGGNAVRCMLEAIWPSFAIWHLDALPESAAITAPDLLSFALFWLASFPFLLVSIPALRWMFLVKIVLMPFFYVALMTWALTAGHGTGPLFSIPNNITSGWSVGYVFCSTILATIGGNATFAVNMADITRYARSPRSSTMAQAVALPVMITLIELLGAIMAATSQVVYGEVLWNPLSIILLWEDRAAKFFAGLLFAFAMIGTNIAGNSIPFANDLMGIFPKYINIRRGQIICAIIGFVSNPWVIQAKASRFFSFIGGYSIFLGPLVGVLLSDYFAVRRCKAFNLVHLYKPHGIYWYCHGWNLRAIAALLVGIIPLLPGLIYNINPDISMSSGILEFYTLGWLDGLLIAL
jgi:NCS1 family nucleobase:cation symporter-1